jgi:hypothetical protein
MEGLSDQPGGSRSLHLMFAGVIDLRLRHVAGRVCHELGHGLLAAEAIGPGQGPAGQLRLVLGHSRSPGEE